MRVVDGVGFPTSVHLHDVQMGSLETKTSLAVFLVTGGSILIAAGLVWFLVATAK